MQIIRKKVLILLFNHGIVDGKAHSTNALRNNLLITFRPEKFDLFTATLVKLPLLYAHVERKKVIACIIFSGVPTMNQPAQAT